MELEKSELPKLTLKSRFSVPDYASKSNKRLFFKPNMFERNSYIPEDLDDRKNEVYLSYPYFDSDTVVFELPDDFFLEYEPKGTSIESDFGSYESTIKTEGRKMIYTRTIKMKGGRFPKETYQELRDFYKGMVKADQMKVVLVNKT